RLADLGVCFPTHWHACVQPLAVPLSLFESYGDQRVVHSFPTRRSSDLPPRCGVQRPHPPERRGARSRDPLPRRGRPVAGGDRGGDRKSTRLNSSHGSTSYAVFCWRKKTTARSSPRGAPAPSPAGRRRGG